MFDDHCCQLTGGGTSVPATGPSRGLVLKLDQSTHVATLVAQYTGSDDNDFESEYMGDTQPLANGNAFVGWGSESYFSEYSRSGQQLLEGNFPGPDLSYRETLDQWVGLPLSAPAGAARESEWQDHSVRELERRHPGRLLEGPGRIQRQSAGRREHHRQVRVRDGDPRATAATRASRCRRSMRRPGDRSFAAILGFDSMMIRATVVLVALAMCFGLCACGSTSSASPDSPEATTANARAAEANPVAVSPEPGTPDASPSTQISFLGDSGTRVSGVHVVGSRSGVHAGVLRAYSTGTGESFLPAHPFVAGERVTVTAQRGNGRCDACGEHDLHGRPPGVGQPDGVPDQPGRPPCRPALQHGADADALDGRHHHARHARRHARRPVPGSLPGRGLARADDRRTERQPGLVPSVAGRRCGHELSGSSSSKASPC